MCVIKRNTLNESQGQAQKKETRQMGRMGMYTILITSYRKRDMDPDNLYPKNYIDQLVEAKIIPDDSSKHISEIIKRVRKVKSEKDERTVIEILRHEEIQPN